MYYGICEMCLLVQYNEYLVSIVDFDGFSTDR